MGQKVNPIIFRMGASQNWRSRWFSDKNYIIYLKQDIAIRRFLKKKLKDASIDKVEIKRSGKEIELVIKSSRPGIIIGRGGSGIEELKKEIIKKYIKNQIQNLKITIEEVKQPMLSAGILLQLVIEQVEKRIPYRRVMKKTIEKAMQAGCDGIKIVLAGRLNGVEIARRETLKDGRLPLHTLRANIDYSRGVASTTYGAIGVKVWVYIKDAKILEESSQNDRRKYSKPNNFGRRDNFNKSKVK